MVRIIDIAANTVQKSLKILFSPRSGWIEHSEAYRSSAELILFYLSPLVLIATLARAVGLLIFGTDVPYLGTFPVTWGSLGASSTWYFLLTLVQVLAWGIACKYLVRCLGLSVALPQAIALASFCATPLLLGGLLQIAVPAWPIISAVLHLYVIVICWYGLPQLFAISTLSTKSRQLLFISLLSSAALIELLIYVSLSVYAPMPRLHTPNDPASVEIIAPTI
jgi:Yip1 domain